MFTPLLKSLTTAIIVFLSRLTFLPANIKPLGAYGFFGNPLLFFLTIVAFDLFVKGFYPGFWFTYLGFSAYPFIGWLVHQTSKSTRWSLIGIPTASFLFFLLSNLGVWWYWYPQNIDGLLTCYLLAIPFYLRTLIGDLGFGYGYLVWKERASLTGKLSRILQKQPSSAAQVS